MEAKGLVVVGSISIHALREEGDISRMFSPRADFAFLSTPSARRATSCAILEREGVKISIHALREEGDSLHKLSIFEGIVFLSTPSARRATQPRTKGR